MRIPLPIASYRLTADSAGAARLVNAYAEQAPQPGGKAPVLVQRTPGTAAFSAPGSGPGRGVHTMAESLYALSGTTLYRVSSSGTVTTVGTVPGTDRVTMADNGTQLAIVTSGGTYVATSASVVAITDPDFPGASSVDFLDTYLLFTEPESGRFFISDIADATSYDALDFATAEGAPDNLVCLRVCNRQVYLFGTHTTEIWWNSGAADFPFERVPSGFVELGCAARDGAVKHEQTLYVLANDRTVRRVEGAQFTRISQHGVEQALRSYARVDDCQAFAWTISGHACVAFRFPSAGACWVYDLTTQEWHERASYAYDGWRYIASADAYGRSFLQDASTGAVVAHTPGAYDEAGNTAVAEFSFAPVYSGNRDMFHSVFEVVAQTGVGLVQGQGSDPTVRLQFSDDGGRNWVEAPSRTLGAIGRSRTRIRWNRLGNARDRVYKLLVSDPVPVTFTDAQVEVEVARA